MQTETKQDAVSHDEIGGGGGAVHWNLPAPALYEHALRRGEGCLSQAGPLVVRTGRHTGRSPDDKFIVREGASAECIWWGAVNAPLRADQFAGLRRRMLRHLQANELFIQDCYVGADPDYRLPIRVITETAWHSLFARNLFIQAEPQELADHTPQFTMLHAPHFLANPAIDGTRSEVFVVISFAERTVLIGGTHYAGEIKKSIFTVLNYLLPQKNVLTMHCSANRGVGGDVALFFGLSGTGKTTLSNDPQRILIGDDEHAWSERGVFNLEGGCYAKVIHLSPRAEPEIHAASERFGTILENVLLDAATAQVNFADDSLTENTRAAYPLEFIRNVTNDTVSDHPTNIIMLTADAFGVLPPVARLTPEQAVYHFLAGYTAKIAGTEKGVREPQATFSACFGAPFMALPPTTYARLLYEKIQRHDVDVWLLNTGWSGGAYGEGERIALAHTRALVRAVLDGSLAQSAFRRDPVFGIAVPQTCPDVPTDVLDPRRRWRDGAAYDAQARRLLGLFEDTLQSFAGQAPAAWLDAAPLAR